MSDKIMALTVTLSMDLSEDQAKHLMSAIALFDGVLNVRGEMSDIGLHVATQRVRREMWSKLCAVMEEK